MSIKPLNIMSNVLAKLNLNHPTPRAPSLQGAKAKYWSKLTSNDANNVIRPLNLVDPAEPHTDHPTQENPPLLNPPTNGRLTAPPTLG